MGRDSAYKQPGQTIVTVPIDPELHRKLRIAAVTEDVSIKELVTRLIREHVETKP